MFDMYCMDIYVYIYISIYHCGPYYIDTVYNYCILHVFIYRNISNKIIQNLDMFDIGSEPQ